MNYPHVNRSIYRNVIIAFASIVAMLLILAMVIPDWRVAIGVITRLVFVVFCFTYSLWIFRSHRNLVAGWLLLVVGIGLLITAAMGYSFNGILPLP